MQVELVNSTDFLWVNGDKELLFVNKSVLNKRNVSPIDQVSLLNKYLKFKGDDYCSLLWDRLAKAHSAIELGLATRELIYIQEIKDIIEVLDIMDIYNYIKIIHKIRPPSGLLDEFTTEIENQGKLYREQTFLKNEYLELVALALALKIIVGPISYFIFINLNLCGDKAEYVGFNFIRDSKLFRSPPMEKTLGMIRKLQSQVNVTSLLIDKKLPSSEIAIYVLSIVAFQRIATATIVGDTNKSNLVNMVFGYARAKLENKSDFTNAIRDKNMNSGGGGDDDTSSSVLEAHKAVSEVTPGKIVEINYFLESVETVIAQSPEYIQNNVTLKECLEVYQKLDIFVEVDIPKQTLVMLTIIFKLTTFPQMRNNIELDKIINMLAVAYVFLKNIGFPEIATIITSKEVLNSRNIVTSVTNRARLSADDKARIAKYFPVRKVNATQSLNVIEEWINATSTSYLDKTWASVIDSVNSSRIIVNNLKPLLANLLCTLEENYYAE